MIIIQSGFESFIMNLAHELYKSEGLASTDLESKLKEKGFTGFLKSEFHNRLGSNWKMSDESMQNRTMVCRLLHAKKQSCPHGIYAYVRRNRAGFYCMQNFIQEIIAFVKNNQKKYPNIARYFVVSIVDENGEVIQYAQDVVFGLSKDITDKTDKTQVTKDKNG